LNRIPYPWTLLGSKLAHPGLDPSLLKLKILMPLWTKTPSQFGMVSSIFFLSSPGQLTLVTFTLSAYPISPDRLTRMSPEQLIPAPYLSFTRSYQCIPGLIRPYSVESPYSILLPIKLLHTRPYTVLPGRNTSPDLFPTRLLPTRSYPATVPD
jgi:hypothetical protein